MMPIWIFAVFIVLFAGAVIWERHSYNKLSDDYKNIEFFLDLYLQKYGQLDGMVIVNEGDTSDNGE